MPNIASEGDCLKACRISSTCLAAQWRIGVDPGCTLTDEYIPNTQIPNGAAVTYVYRESCPEPPPLPTPPANGNSSITTGRGFGSTTFAGGSGNSSASSTISGSNTGSSLSPGFGTSFPASGSTTSSSGPTCWVLTNDTNFLQGVANIATSVSQCQAACQAQTSPLCIAVDWDRTRPSGSQCFLNSIAQNKNSAPGVDHYDFVCANSSSATGSTIGSSGSGNSAGSSAASVSSTTFLQLSSTTAPSQSCWLQMNDTLIPQGLDNNATSVIQCQTACRAQTSPKCLSVDWDKTRATGRQCFLHSTSQGKSPATGVDHYDLICM